MNMNFGRNKTLLEVIKERAFGGAYFRDLFYILVLMVNGTENHGKNLMS